MKIADELDEVIFTCMYCRKKFGITEGTFPQYLGKIPVLNSDLNTRIHSEFVCYNCCD